MNKVTLGPPSPEGSFCDHRERFHLEPGVIFVFGSNCRGIHGAGSAKDALKQFGAKWGQSEGLQGQSYGLPTCEVPGVGLGLLEIKQHVQIFRDFVNEHPELTFFVTAVGCGYAGYKNHQIAPLFNDIPRCWFPDSWKPFLAITKPVEDNNELR